ncbi:MAG: sigma-70 family RNA polymerase sigma factor [Anaerolineae bacterium]|nr:sigma-70 family RNA polymerase sigma factor [Anaerolineae bacterium]
MEGIALDLETYKLLLKQDWETIGPKLVAFGIRYAERYWWRHGNGNLPSGNMIEDVVQELIARTLSGERQWDPNKIDLVRWLKQQLPSLINHLCHSAPNKHEVAILENDDGEQLTDQIEYQAYRFDAAAVKNTADPEKLVLTEEAIRYRESVLVQAIDGDTELERILDVICDGCEPKARHLAEELGIPVQDVYNQLKRLRRRVDKLMKGAQE